MIYESIIIGRGLIGCAAAKYISASQKNVELIGPDESRTSQEQIVFASHYDQARIQAIIGKDAVTTQLNQQSAKGYATLEKETHNFFHSKEGCLTIFPNEPDAFLQQYKNLAERFLVDYTLLENDKSVSDFNKNFNFPSSAKGIYEHSPCGHINP